jgi:autotransporter-associated beta strand protein
MRKLQYRADHANFQQPRCRSLRQLLTEQKCVQRCTRNAIRAPQSTSAILRRQAAGIFRRETADGNAVLQLTKSGSGGLILSGDNRYSGGTVMNAGRLVVASPLALGLGNVMFNGGVLRADPQPINVQGDYTQRAGGTLQLTVAVSVSGQYDFLNVRGHATLDGTLRLISLNGFQPKFGDKFTLVTAGGGSRVGLPTSSIPSALAHDLRLSSSTGRMTLSLRSFRRRLHRLP